MISGIMRWYRGNDMVTRIANLITNVFKFPQYNLCNFITHILPLEDELVLIKFNMSSYNFSIVSLTYY
jgi:hypothetical protein